MVVKQLNRGAESTYRITLCAHLIKPNPPSGWLPLNKVATQPVLLTTKTYLKPETEKIIFGSLQADVVEHTVKPAKIVLEQLEPTTAPAPLLSIFTPPPESVTEDGSGSGATDMFDD